MLRPMIVAPIPVTPATAKSSSTPSSPPSCPIISRPNRVVEHPLVQALAADAERVLEALVGPGAVAVERDREVVDAQFGHRCSCRGAGEVVDSTTRAAVELIGDA